MFLLIPGVEFLFLFNEHMNLQSVTDEPSIVSLPRAVTDYMIARTYRTDPLSDNI